MLKLFKYIARNHLKTKTKSQQTSSWSIQQCALLNNLSETFKWKWINVFVWINVVRLSAVTEAKSNVHDRLWKRQYNQTGTHSVLTKVGPSRRSFNNSAINSASNCALNENCCWENIWTCQRLHEAAAWQSGCVEHGQQNILRSLY